MTGASRVENNVDAEYLAVQNDAEFMCKASCAPCYSIPAYAKPLMCWSRIRRL